MTDYELILGLVKENSQHIGTINSEMGMILQRISVLETKLDVIFLMVSGLAIKVIWEVLSRTREAFNNKKK